MFSSRMLLWNKTYCVCSEKDRAPRIVDVAQKDSKGNNKNETTSSANVRLKFNILERKKKTQKKLPPLCSLQNLYLWPSFLSYLFYMCSRSNLIPFNYEIVWMDDVIQELYKHEWQEDLIQTSWGFRFQGSFIDTVNALNETVLPWAELVPFVLATPSVKLSYFKIALRGIMCISGTLHD